MTREQFDGLVKHLEGYARERPANYKLRVGLFAALGYAYILFVVMVLLALIGVILAAATVKAIPKQLLWKFGWVLAAFVFVIARALWVRFTPPEGIRVRRADASKLFDLIDRLTSRLKAPRFHRVLLTDDFNAAVVQIPRLGVLGWQRNYLLLGIPLMGALTPEEFQAVLAHELGHLSGQHGRFSGWIYRVRLSWLRLMDQLEHERHWGSFVFTRFFNWYAPFFSAYSFVLGRGQEYEADRVAAAQAGRQVAGQALLKIAVQSYFLEQSFWPNLMRRADHQAEPPGGPVAPMLKAFAGVLPPEEIRKGFDRSRKEKTNNADTHPCLTDRLAALGLRLEVSDDGDTDNVIRGDPLKSPLKASAADAFLGSAVGPLAARLDQIWIENAGQRWRERYEYVQESLKNLQRLNEKACSQMLTAEEAWDRARWTGDFLGDEAALPLLQDFLASHPDHPQANYVLGRLLLEAEDARGIDYIEKAMAKEPESVLPGCDLLYDFFRRHGREEEAKRVLARYDQHAELVGTARQERRSASRSDGFEPHGLSPDAIEPLGRQLACFEEIHAAYLVRKVVKVFPEKPCFVLCVVYPYKWYQFQSDDRDQEFAGRLASELKFPGETIVLVAGVKRRKWEKTLEGIRGAEIYRR